MTPFEREVEAEARRMWAVTQRGPVPLAPWSNLHAEAQDEYRALARSNLRLWKKRLRALARAVCERGDCGCVSGWTPPNCPATPIHEALRRTR